MSKELSEMSLEELWELFPIFLVTPNSQWQEWFLEEKEKLFKILGEKNITSCEHIGSTAIPNIQAKNIVDILIELPTEVDMSDISTRLQASGYIEMSHEENRISLNKGYTKTGFAERVFHLHLRFEGDKDEVFFRDYLRENPEIAEEYEKLKVTLSQKYPNNRDAYTDAKTSFIKKWTHVAKEK